MRGFRKIFPVFAIVAVAVPFFTLLNIDVIDDHDSQQVLMQGWGNLAMYTDRYKYHPPQEASRNHPPQESSQLLPNKDDLGECGDSPDFEKYFTVSSKRRSRFNEDKKIYERFFKPHTKDGGKLSQNGVGTFVELGAFDGLHETNTRFYEACLGWEGLLIEGNPSVYEKLKGHRPWAHRMSFAPSCQEEGQTIQFVNLAMTNVGVPGHAKAYGERSSHHFVDVPCGPLSPILSDVFNTSGGHIDFFSLDVEGAEALVLDTIDFKQVRVDIFMIEVENSFCKQNKKCEVRDKVHKKMEEAGYKQKYNVVRASEVWVHPDSPYANM